MRQLFRIAMIIFNDKGLNMVMKKYAEVAIFSLHENGLRLIMINKDLKLL